MTLDGRNEISQRKEREREMLPFGGIFRSFEITKRKKKQTNEEKITTAPFLILVHPLKSIKHRDHPPPPPPLALDLRYDETSKSSNLKTKSKVEVLNPLPPHPQLVPC